MRVLVTALILALGAWPRWAPALPIQSVELLKCCSEGYDLDLAHGDGTSCRPAPDDGWTRGWRPIYYDVATSFMSETLPSAWNVREGAQPVCKNSVSATVVPAHDAGTIFVVVANGSLFVLEYKMTADAGTFCLDSRAALVCIDDGSKPDQDKKVQVKLCCGEGAAYSEERGACVVNAEDDVPVPEGVGLSTGFPACPGSELVIAGSLGESDAEVKADGSMLLRRAGPATLRPGEFCLVRVLGPDAPPGISVFACHDRLAKGGLPGGGGAGTRGAGAGRAHDGDIRFSLYPVGLVLSVFFLAATLATGCLLPGNHHVLHWRCQTAHVACLLVGDLLLAVTQLAGASMPPAACTTVAVFMHFFFLAAFFWLNTMCFNIWWTFRDLRPASLDKSQENCRLRLYQLYAWGGPLVIAGIAAIVDNLPEDSQSNVLRPRFGDQRCWFYGDAEIFSYFYGPVGLLLALNLILFGATARELTCGLWKREVVKSSTERATLGRVCLKLVIVMGLTWVADIVSWAVGGPNAIWYVTDFINALQGVFIFAVVGCQPQVWAAVNRLWCWHIPRAGTTNTGQPLSTYSQGLPSMGESITNSNTQKCTPLETTC